MIPNKTLHTALARKYNTQAYKKWLDIQDFRLSIQESKDGKTKPINKWIDCQKYILTKDHYLRHRFYKKFKYRLPLGFDDVKVLKSL